MSLARNFDEYKDEIELIQMQNRVECDLYSIIACMIRESSHGADISLRDVSSRRKSDFSRPFMGDSGFPDFVVRTREKQSNAGILGAIEIKYLTKDLAFKKHLDQLDGHIKFYKRVLYTNGLKWQFYHLIDGTCKMEWEINVGKIDNGTITWEDDTQWQSLLNKLDDLRWDD